MARPWWNTNILFLVSTSKWISSSSGWISFLIDCWVYIVLTRSEAISLSLTWVYSLTSSNVSTFIWTLEKSFCGIRPWSWRLRNLWTARALCKGISFMLLWVLFKCWLNLVLSWPSMRVHWFLWLRMSHFCALKWSSILTYDIFLSHNLIILILLVHHFPNNYSISNLLSLWISRLSSTLSLWLNSLGVLTFNELVFSLLMLCPTDPKLTISTHLINLRSRTSINVRPLGISLVIGLLLHWGYLLPMSSPYGLSVAILSLILVLIGYALTNFGLKVSFSTLLVHLSHRLSQILLNLCSKFIIFTLNPAWMDLTS